MPLDSAHETREMIAVDLDDVLFDFIGHFFEWHNQVYGTSIERQDMVYRVLWDAWGGTKEEALERIPRFLNRPEHLDLDPIPGAVEVLRRLKRRYQLSIISAREPEAAESTSAWLGKYFDGIFEQVHLGIANPMSSKRLSKAKVCLQIGATTLIDDQLIHIEECVNSGIRVLVFGEQVWNRADNLPESAVRVADWEAVGRVLLEGG
jgi:5'(3')-deoxyribonucleotidase